MREAITNTQFLLTVPEVAQILRTGPARVRKYVREGKLRCVFHGRRILIPQSEPQRFIREEAE